MQGDFEFIGLIYFLGALQQNAIEITAFEIFVCKNKAIGLFFHHLLYTAIFWWS